MAQGRHQAPHAGPAEGVEHAPQSSRLHRLLDGPACDRADGKLAFPAACEDTRMVGLTDRWLGMEPGGRCN